jgi:predicted nucleotidyltransferase component of viral defense system
MNKYNTGSAFSQALHKRLNDKHLAESISLDRLRNDIAFERFLARLLVVSSDTWLLKGGLAMQLRLGKKTRTTSDIDLAFNENEENFYDVLSEASSINLEDWFTFEVEQPSEREYQEGFFGGIRYDIICLLDSKLFERFHIDVGGKTQIIDDYETFAFEPALDFAGIQSTLVPCYPVPLQIAEKLHALTRKYKSGSSSRGKDMIDILLLARARDINGKLLSNAIRHTFGHRGTHTIPKALSSLPRSIQREYSKLSKEVDLDYPNFEAAEKALKSFINPVLDNTSPGNWDSVFWKWDN